MCCVYSVNTVLSLYVISGVQYPCNVTWRNHSDTSAPGVTYFQQYATVDDCLLGCVHQQPGCVAAIVRNQLSYVACYLLTNRNNLFITYVSRGVTLHVLNRTCGKTGISQQYMT